MIHLAELKLDELDIKFQDTVAFIGIYIPEIYKERDWKKIDSIWRKKI